MRRWLISIFIMTMPGTVFAADTEWFVSVYGENMQMIGGASETDNVIDGQYLDPNYRGKVIFVKTQYGYELDQFRPAETVQEGTSTSASVASVSESADAAASSPPPTARPDTEFGPLPDTGVQYVKDGDFPGWYCANIYVLPMEGSVYRLRCDEEMKHN